MAWHWTCLMAIRSFSRQTWEWEFSQRLGPHLKGVLTRTCTGSLLTCWPCAWEPDLLLYIYQNLKSLGNSYPLPVNPCVAHRPVSAVLPAPSPASWHTAEASSGEGGQLSPPASWVTQGPELITSPAFSLLSFRQALPVLEATPAHLYFCPFLFGIIFFLPAPHCFVEIMYFLSSHLLIIPILSIVSQIPLPNFRFLTLCSRFYSSPAHITLSFLLSHEYMLDSPLHSVAPDFPVYYIPEYSAQEWGGQRGGTITQNLCTLVQMPL